MDIKAILSKARDLEEARDHGAAMRAYLEVVEAWPSHFGALMGAGRTACKAGDRARGMDLFRTAARLHPGRPEPLLNLARQLSRDDLESAATVTRDALARFPGHAGLEGLMRKLDLQLDRDSHLKTIDLDRELADPKLPESVYTTALRYQKPVLSQEKYLEYQARIAEAFRNNRSRLRHAMSLVEHRQHARALPILEDLNEDTGPRVALGRSICKAALGATNEARSGLARYFEAESDPLKRLIGAANLLDAAADPPAAARLIAEVNRFHADPGVENLLALFDEIRPPLRPLMEATPQDKDFHFLSPSGSTAAAIVFAGFRFKIGALPLSVLDRFLAGHGIGFGWAIDRRGRLFHEGVESLGGSTERTATALRSLLAEAGVARLYTLGSSAGGFGATIFGNMLGAHRTLTFSTPANMSKAFIEEIGDPRAQAVIHALDKRLTREQLDLAGWFENRSERQPLHAYYCTGEPHDTAHAERLGKVSGVTLVPVAGYDGHESFGAAIATGQLLTELRAIVEESAPADTRAHKS